LGSGSIYLTAIDSVDSRDDDDSDVLVNQLVTSASGDITIFASDNVVWGNPVPVQVFSGPGQIQILAADGQVLMTDGANVTADTGEIRVEAETDVVVGQITTSHDDSTGLGLSDDISLPAVFLLAVTGDIQDTASGSADCDIDAMKGRVVVRATQGSLGSEQDCLDITHIRTRIYQLDVYTKTAIYVKEEDDLQVVRLRISGSPGSKSRINTGGSLEYVAVVEATLSPWLV
jgi:hypothetical protein